MCFYQSGGGTRGAVEGMQASQFYLCCCKCLLCLSPLCSLKSRCPWFACVPLGATDSVHSVPRVHGSLLSRKLPMRAGLPRQPPGSPIFPVMASTVQQGPWNTWSKAHPLPVTSTSHAGRKQEGQKVLGAGASSNLLLWLWVQGEWRQPSVGQQEQVCSTQLRAGLHRWGRAGSIVVERRILAMPCSARGCGSAGLCRAGRCRGLSELLQQRPGQCLSMCLMARVTSGPRSCTAYPQLEGFMDF